MSAVPLIALRGIERTYRMAGGEPVPVLRGIDLDIDRGDFVALVGPSGSGKTTLMQLIGLIDAPDAGSYRLDGHEIAGLSDDAVSALRSRTVGFVFQSFHLIPQMDLIDNVALPLLYQGRPTRERRQRAAEALERVGLGHRLTHRPVQLSGGEQQRTAIARALASTPRLLVADEPTGNLDTKTGTAIMGLIRELHAQGLTIVMVTHDKGIAAQASRIVRMRDGRLEDDATADVLAATTATAAHAP